MKIRFEFEIPDWTRWIAAGIAIGISIGYGISVVHADPVSVKTWNSGDLLTAAALNKNFTDLQNAINAINASDCPFGYAPDTNTTAFVLCKRGSDEIVKVGVGGARFWIDRYEASIWNRADGSGTQYGLNGPQEFPSGFPINGQYTSPLYALSLPGKQPSAYVTWFQADAACEASGKRLATRDEWFRAARGTVDPSLSDGSGGDCYTTGTAVRNTGLGPSCRSRWGAEDMIGNLAEWASDWFLNTPSALQGTWAPVPWSSALFNSDGIYGVTSYAIDESQSVSASRPAAVVLGGVYGQGSSAGIFSLNLLQAPGYANADIGFRCVTLR